MKLLRRNYSIRELYILRKSIIKVLLNYHKIINYFLVKISSILKLEKCLGLPFNILIEPTGECNYRCIKCERFSEDYVDDGPVYGHKDMPFDYYCRIIDDIGDFLITLRLWHYGEPLLHEDIFRMIAYAKKKNILVALSSTLSTLTEETAGHMIKSGLDYLIISFDGASEKTYNFYHGHNSFNNVVSNIKLLVQEKEKHKSVLPFIELQFIVMRENEHEIDSIQQLADTLEIDKLTYLKLTANRINYDVFENMSTDKDILPSNKSFCFNNREKKTIPFCSVPWEEAVIRYSGVVIPCAMDIGQKHKMGKLFQDNQYVEYGKIWNSDQYCNFRQNISVGLEKTDICAICEKRNNNANDQITMNKK